MNLVRILVLVVAGLAAVFAAVFVRGAMQAPAAPVSVEAEAPEPVMVLAAASDVLPGSRLTGAELRWTPWPEEAVLPGHVTREADPDAVTRLTGAVTRGGFAAGEPVLEGRLVHPGEAGFMAAVLTPGMRAVAVPISARSGAGGFILPNDRIDVIAAIDRDGGMTTEIVVENARVLAIDQSYSDAGDGAVVGSTATIELSPEQARAVALAVAGGDVSLALRSVADGQGGPRLPGEAAEPEIVQTPDRVRTVRVIRYGREERVALGGQ